MATFRAHLRPALVWGVSLCLLIVLLVVLHWRQEVPTDEERRSLMEQISAGGLGFMQILFGEMHNLTEFGGFAEWYGLGLMPLVVGVVMVLTATAVTRGAEERGEAEMLVTMPLSRGRAFAEQTFGLVLILALLAGFIWLGLVVSGPAAGAPVISMADAALAAANVAAIAALFATLGLLISQFTRSRRIAASVAGGLLVAGQLWANIGLLVPSLEGWRWLSPFYLYSQNSPLTGEPAYEAIASLALASVLCAAASGVFFARRDLGASVNLPFTLNRRRSSSGTWLLGGALQGRLRGMLGPALLWAAGLSLYAAVFTAVTPSVSGALQEQRGARDLLESLGAGDATADASIVTFTLFAWLPALAGIFAVTLAGGFAAEERAGRLELEMTVPGSRVAVFLTNAAAAMLAIALTVGLTGATFLGTGLLADLDLSWGNAAAAAFLMVLPAWTLSSFGLFLAGWRPHLTASVATVVLVGSFFFDILAEPLDMPELVRKLSIFQLYGRPLIDGISWPETIVMLALTALFLLAGSRAFTQRDILK